MNLGHEPLLEAERSLVVAMIPDELVVELPIAEWPADWAADIHCDATRDLGDQWVREAPSLGLIVPSAALSPPPSNVLINPAHPEFGRLVIERIDALTFNARLANDSG